MIEIPFVIELTVSLILVIAILFAISSQRHITWISYTLAAALFLVNLNGFAAKVYKRAHQTPPTAQVWFPDVPVKDVRESTVRLAILTGTEKTVLVICPKWFDPDASRHYTIDAIRLETGDGRFTSLIWELRVSSTPNR